MGNNLSSAHDGNVGNTGEDNLEDENNEELESTEEDFYSLSGFNETILDDIIKEEENHMSCTNNVNENIEVNLYEDEVMDILDQGENDDTVGCMGKIGKSKSLTSFLTNFSIENSIQTQMNKNQEFEKQGGLRRSTSVEFPTIPSFMGCLGVSENDSSTQRQFSRSSNDLISQSQDAYTMEELNMPHGDQPIPESDLSTPRTIYIVTTAALPWMTGTAVNPLLRAAYLKKTNPMHSVTIVIPWLENREDRRHLFGDGNLFSTGTKEQELYIRDWLRDKAQLPREANPETGIQILFYPGRYHSGLNSIFALGDLCSLIPDESADVCILEEPEHLNWYRAPTLGLTWQTKFNHVVGIIHTNYKEYARSSQVLSGLVISPLLAGACVIVVRAYCHKVIKLSEVLQTFAPEKEIVTNVHGIRSEFLDEGRRRGIESASTFHQSPLYDNKISQSDLLPSSSGRGKIYFIGKLLWVKGLDRILRFQFVYRRSTGDFFPIDIYGSGPQETEIKNRYLGRKNPKGILQDKKNKSMIDEENGEEMEYTHWRKHPIPARFLGRIDHAQLKGDEYKIFVNPSISEVLATTTAEAIAMGRFAIIPFHPSNIFFERFPNCLMYEDKNEFVFQLQYALNHEPSPLSEELRYCLTWEAATERLIQASIITERDEKRRRRLGRDKLDQRLATIWDDLWKGAIGDLLRKIFGAGPVSDQVQNVTEIESDEV